MNTVTNFPMSTPTSFYEQNGVAIRGMASGAAFTLAIIALIHAIGYAVKPKEVKKLEQLHANEKKSMKFILKWLKKTSTKFDEASFESYQSWALENAKDAAVSVNQFKKTIGICKEIAEEKSEQGSEDKKQKSV